MAFTVEELLRYQRNLLLPGMGEEGQARLEQARVCVVGLGGLGSAAAFYLASAGVGTLGLVDSDVVELSNLQRQILHTTDRVGVTKVESARVALAALNPGVAMELHSLRLDAANAAGVLEAYDVVVEATDNFEAKYLVNDRCLELRKPFATAGILAYSGQALFVVPGQSACLRCAVPAPPRGVATTAQLGVLGAVPGILGSLEAMEVIRWIAGLWRPLGDGAGRLHAVDGQAMHLHTAELPRRNACCCQALWSAL